MAEQRLLINPQKIKSRKGYHFVKRTLDIIFSLKVESTKTDRTHWYH